MSYQLVQIPLARPFDEADAAELRAYAKWVKEIMPERNAALESAVRETPGFDSWRADGTPESLRRLGSWFADRVTTRPPTDEEMADFLRPGILTAETAPKWVLDHRTLSYVFDVALYLARVFMSENAGVRWGLQLRSKRNADYGRPVLVGLGRIPLNPFRVVDVAALRIAHHEAGAEVLLAVYECWIRYAKATGNA